MNERMNERDTERSRQDRLQGDGDDVMRQTTPSQAEGERGKEEDEEQETKRRPGM
ncbi:hypothetical protein [Streptomyces sp. NPDC058664]|uniref:hypothetical protein n=1 Tax=unclassified Streptomyces TaxID=2593676 RepID=UPI00364EA519